MDLDGFLEGAASCDRFCRDSSVAGRASNHSLYDACTRLKIVRNGCHGKEASAPLHRRACTGACACLVERVACTK